MAYINNYYVFVQDGGESVTHTVTVSDHPVEDGMVITDNVKKDPVQIKLTGKIVGTNAETVKAALIQLQKSGSYVKYIGKEILSNAVITAFETSRTVSADGAIGFTMTVREIHVAVSAYKNTSTGKTVKSGTQQVTVNNTSVYHTVRSGDTLYSLALMYYGTDSYYTTLYSANKSTIENAAKSAGYTSSDGGGILVKGTKLLIP